MDEFEMVSYGDIFSMNGDVIIQDETDIGIINGKLTTGVPYRNVLAVSGLWAPPVVSSNFLLEGRVFGEKVRTENYMWHPFQVERSGRIRDVLVSSRWTLIYGHRAGVLSAVIENEGSQPAPVDFLSLAWLSREERWGFARPTSSGEAIPKAAGNELIFQRGDVAIYIISHTENLRWTVSGNLGSASVVVPPNATVSLRLAVSVGPAEEARISCEQLAKNPLATVQATQCEYRKRVSDIFEKLPRLVSSNSRLVNLYNRSLLPLLLNQWEVPDFVLNPYYSTGSIKGGCVGSYLWDFGQVWRILPLYAPDAVREHIKRYLQIDLTRHFLFDPLTGKPDGPWYMVNQEKIIGLTYFYVASTGDKNFLSEVVNGTTVIEHMICHAMYGDNVDEQQRLIDYGTSNSHLELRREFPYNHVMPDLNGRRYDSYHLAAALCELAGMPARFLIERAAQLKQIFKSQLWDSSTRWLWCANEHGKYMRYTVQMFKLFGSGILDQEMESGLASHLNDQEFLSAYGLHSMSKKDAAYDQLDIDNGGGGICTGFPAQVIEKLYRAGLADNAADILERILWWADVMPYWGDSITANCKDYRRDTPLQNMLDGAAVAQCIIFGVFGVDPQLDGTVAIHPHSLSFSPNIALKALKLRGRNMDISVDDTTFRVSCDGRALELPLGETILLDTSSGHLRSRRAAMS